MKRRIILILACAMVICMLGPIVRAQEQKKLAFGILIDNTGSMRGQFETVLNLGRGIVHQVHNHGPVSIFDFESEGIGPGMRARPVVRIEASQNEELLSRTVDNLYVEGGQTTLLDAIDMIAGSLEQKFPDATKIIVVISDGEDRVSRIKKETLVQQLKEEKIAVFAIGLTQQLEKHKSKSTDLLNFLTKETGGRAVFPNSKTANVDQIVTALALPLE